MWPASGARKITAGPAPRANKKERAKAGRCNEAQWVSPALRAVQFSEFSERGKARVPKSRYGARNVRGSADSFFFEILRCQDFFALNPSDDTFLTRKNSRKN